MEPALTPQQRKLTSKGGFALYREYVAADRSLPGFLFQEVIFTLFGSLGGLAGMAARSIFYPFLFAACRKRPAIGRGVLIRNPSRISIGRSVLIDDLAALDARDAGAEIELGDCVAIGRLTTVAAKGGKIRLAAGVNVGSYSRIATQTSVSIGESTLIAAYAYIGPGNHQLGDDKTPLISKEMELKDGVSIGKHCWIGTRATILDGVKIGDNAIVGAHSLVREDVPAGAIVAGTPAKIIGSIPSQSGVDSRVESSNS